MRDNKALVVGLLVAGVGLAILLRVRRMVPVLPGSLEELAERDAVEEASWESFPASDAPGWTGATAT